MSQNVQTQVCNSKIDYICITMQGIAIFLEFDCRNIKYLRCGMIHSFIRLQIHIV